MRGFRRLGLPLLMKLKERQHLNGICVTTRAVNQVHHDKQPGTNERVSKTRRGRAASGSGREHSPWVYEMLCLALF